VKQAAQGNCTIETTAPSSLLWPSFPSAGPKRRKKMSLITDLRAVSGNAVEQLAARFADLPRPVLAAIGAGDMAVERLAELRESLPARPGNPLHGTDVRAAVSDLPTRAQQVASNVAGSMEQFAGEAPGRAQDLLAQLPDKLAELQTAAQFLSPDAVKETVEAYGQLAGMIYGSLAERGDNAWSKVRAAGFRPGAVADAAVADAAVADAAVADAAVADVAVAKVRPAGPATPRVPGATGAQDDSADSAVAADSADGAVRTVDAPVVPSAPVVPTGHTAPSEAADVAEPDAGAAPAPARKPRAPRVTAPISVPRPAVAKAVGPRPAARKPAAPRKPAG